MDIVPHDGISICGGVMDIVENMVGDKLNELQSKSITSLERKVNLLNNVILNPHKYNTKIVTLEMMDEVNLSIEELKVSIEDIHVELAQLRSNDELNK